MTNVSTPKKRATRRGLFAFAVETLEKQGWKVTRTSGGASVRQITRGSESYKVSIRTSQDAWIAFPRKHSDAGWVTLDDVDYVIAVSVNDRNNPTLVRVHMIPGEDARARFNRAYAARKRANHVVPIGRGIWLSLYDEESPEPVNRVGAGMGLVYQAIATLDLARASLPSGDEADDDFGDGHGREDTQISTQEQTQPPLTIAEAKQRLAATLGVPESAIKITVEH